MPISNDAVLIISFIAISILNIALKQWNILLGKRLHNSKSPTVREEAKTVTKKSKQHRLRHRNLRVKEDFLSINRYMPSNRREMISMQVPLADEVADEPVTLDPPLKVPNQRRKSKWGMVTMDELPYLPGCEPDGPAAKEMEKLFPDASIPDIIRFLVARKGDVAKAAEMFGKSNDWRASKLPLKRELAAPAVATNCFFAHGEAKDGTPVLYMRGAFYDNRVTSAEVYVLLAAHTIDYVLQRSKKISVTVLVHAVAVPGAPNLDVDTNFIKLFIQVLSDNYPERLKRLVIYPFPWYGRAIWSFLKVFVDKRSQDKVLLLSYGGKGVPPDLEEFIDPNQIPVCCGGKSTAEIKDLMATFEEPDESLDEFQEFEDTSVDSCVAGGGRTAGATTTAAAAAELASGGSKTA